MASNVVRLPKPTQEPISRRIMLAADFWGMEPEPKDDIVEGVIPCRHATLLSGRAGYGKSFISQMLMTAAAVEHDWLGMPVRRCKSLGIFAEDPAGKLRERQEKICRHYGIEYLDMANSVNIWPNDDGNFFIFSCFRVYGQGTPRSLWAEKGGIEEFCREEGIELIILDNAKHVFDGNHGSAQHVTSFMRWLNGRARALNAAIVVVKNPPKDRSSYFSGIQDWEDAARHTLSLSQPRDREGNDIENEFVLKVEKSNYLAYNHPLKRRGIALEWKDGILVHRATDDHGPLDKLDSLKLDDRVVKAVSHAVGVLGHVFAANPQSPNYIVGKLIPSVEKAGYTWGDLAASVDRLLTNGGLIKVAVKDVWLIRATGGRPYLGESA